MLDPCAPCTATVSGRRCTCSPPPSPIQRCNQPPTKRARAHGSSHGPARSLARARAAHATPAHGDGDVRTCRHLSCSACRSASQRLCCCARSALPWRSLEAAALRSSLQASQPASSAGCFGAPRLIIMCGSGVGAVGHSCLCAAPAPGRCTPHQSQGTACDAGRLVVPTGPAEGGLPACPASHSPLHRCAPSHPSPPRGAKNAHTTATHPIIISDLQAALLRAHAQAPLQLGLTPPPGPLPPPLPRTCTAAAPAACACAPTPAAGVQTAMPGGWVGGCECRRGVGGPRQGGGGARAGG